MTTPQELRAFCGNRGEWAYVADASDETNYVFKRGAAAGTVKAKGKRKGTEPEEMAATATAAAATGAETGRRRRK